MLNDREKRERYKSRSEKRGRIVQKKAKDIFLKERGKKKSKKKEKEKKKSIMVGRKMRI